MLRSRLVSKLHVQIGIRKSWMVAWSVVLESILVVTVGTIWVWLGTRRASSASTQPQTFVRPQHTAGPRARARAAGSIMLEGLGQDGSYASYAAKPRDQQALSEAGQLLGREGEMARLQTRHDELHVSQ